jgi:methyl acetate hydrolase
MKMTSSLDAILSAAVQSGKVPPVAAIAVDKAGVIYKGAFGPSRMDRNDTINSDAIFQLHSMTKAITGTGCMQLVEQGRISLDDDCSLDLKIMENQLRALPKESSPYVAS